MGVSSILTLGGQLVTATATTLLGGQLLTLPTRPEYMSKNHNHKHVFLNSKSSFLVFVLNIQTNYYSKPS